VQDYSKWQERRNSAVADAVIERLKTEFMPQAANQISADTEWKRLEGEFTREFNSLPEYGPEWMDHMNVYINRERKASPNSSPQELYDAAKPKFMKTFGTPNKKSGKKVVPLESPGKAKEKMGAAPEKPMDMEDWERQNRDYVAYRQKKAREMQGG
jgi:hypothetical protein